jgi:DNA-binding response OmpR family regulator
MARILVVEDEPLMQKGLRDNLSFEGYEVEIAGDGETGLARIRECHRYSLLPLGEVRLWRPGDEPPMNRS